MKHFGRCIVQSSRKRTIKVKFEQTAVCFVTIEKLSFFVVKISIGSFFYGVNKICKETFNGKRQKTTGIT
ncbi:hypothetical protein LBYZC6_48180 [Lacrimispora brassicae]